MSRPRYSDKVLELFSALPTTADLPAGGAGRVSAEACALDRQAWIQLFARIEGGKFAECDFRAWGCPHTLAAAAWVAQHRSGQWVAGAQVFDVHRLVEELAVPVEKLGRLLVIQDAEAQLLRQAASLL